MGARRIGLLGVDFTDNHFFAKTGRHPLAGSLQQINEEYKKLGAALASRGVELVNLSHQSRLTALPRQHLSAFLATQTKIEPEEQTHGWDGRKIFFVHYHFLSCGDVFREGLMHAAADLRVRAREAYWDDAGLPGKIRAFAPDLVFVVHGRRCVQRWNGALREWNSAVWLVDEPYEVDDTSRWSSTFRTVFVNDPVTLARHRNSHYLPVCFDPRVHFDSLGPRPFGAGFIGGSNPRREQCLSRLAKGGLLRYVVGGPWQDPALKKLCRSPNIPAAQTANLYRQTKIVINIFRQQHHYNRQRLPVTALNPRIYEALACGALVISEPRPELEQLCPTMPIFRDERDLLGLVRQLHDDEKQTEKVQHECATALRAHTYAERLRTVLLTCWPMASGFAEPAESTVASVITRPAPASCGIPSSDGDRASSFALTGIRSSTGNRPRFEPLLFSAMPRRNLIYHVWPVRDSLWRWNIEQLLQRIDIFNGRRIVGIVHDSKSESPEEVIKSFEGHGCEFVVRANDSLGEAITFPEMLERVASEDPNEITFYAHAKGVKYGPNASPPVRQWSEALYITNLDDWLRVLHQLEQFAMTGAFKMRGRFRSHRECSDWHYSGTFFWFRHAHVFSRSWRVVPQFYCGVEAWPGTLFQSEETGCLFFDGITELPYLANFWRRRGDAALKGWLAARKLVSIPDNLAHPLAPAREAGPRLEQVPGEFEWLTSQLLAAGVRSVLTIGALHGGMEWWLARAYHNAGVSLQLTVIESNPLPDLRVTLDDAMKQFGASIKLIEGSSRFAVAQGQLESPFDFVFSDADHRYAGVRADLELARAVNAPRIAFHDILDSHWHVQCRCCVSRLWHELKNRYQTCQYGQGDWGGIGVASIGEERPIMIRQ
jgi:hypothetical protein